MKRFFHDKRILVTGGCGTVGSELVHQLLTGEYGPREVLVFDSHEQSLFFLNHRYSGHKNFNCVLGNVRDAKKLGRVMHQVDVVFHTAALKHVFLCERSPFEAVQTNIMGVQNVISAAMESRVRTVVFTSSDKAVNPTNVMGTSKLMGERLIAAANAHMKAKDTVFASVRFGNVLGSSGSVIPIFHNQISKGGPVTLTDPAMTRFIMSIKQAVRLIIDSAVLARGGEIFITKMPVARIQDLAEVMIERLAPEYGHDPRKVTVEIIGTKPGEKMYEELMTDEEKGHSLELENYFVTLPALRGLYRYIAYDYASIVSSTVEKTYNSSNETPLSKEALAHFLEESELLVRPKPEADVEFHHRHWPGD